MWEFGEVDGYSRSLKRFAKKHRQEAINAIDNAEAFRCALNSGLKPQHVDRGFIHHEPHGIKAFDESGPGAHKKATRLYGYPDEPTETLHLIIIGGKDGQDRDIEVCRKFVIQLLKDRERENLDEDIEEELEPDDEE